MRFLQSFTLPVELFAGTDIVDASYDLQELADRVGTRCEASFNGVKLWARPGGDPRKLVGEFHECMERGSKAPQIAQS